MRERERQHDKGITWDSVRRCSETSAEAGVELPVPRDRSGASALPGVSSLSWSEISMISGSKMGSTGG